MPSRWLVAVSAAGFSVGLAALAASCGGGNGGGTTSLVDNDPPATTSTTVVSNVPPAASSDGGDAGVTSCAGGTSAGCPCTTVGAQISCGQVHRVSGTYISCSPGFQTCDANGQWGACLGDGVGDPRGPDRGYLLDSLQLDASSCITNPCDPSCQNFVDNAAGLDAGPDSGLVFADSGISLSPIYPDSGAVCTGFTISPLNQTITVQTLPKTTDPPNTVPTVSYSGGQQYSATAVPVGCFTDVVPALWGMDRNDIGTFDSTTGYLTVFTGVATLAPVNIAAFVGGLTAQYTKATIIVDAHDTSAAGSFASSFSSAGSGGDPGNQILYPYDGTVLPLGLQPPIVQWNNNGHPADAVAITLRYPDTSPVFSWQGISATESPSTTSVPGLETASGLAAAPRFAIDPDVWSDFEQTAKGNATTMSQPAIISVQRIYGGHLYQEQKVKVFFAPGQLKGKVYYQSYETQLVKNSDYVLADGSQVGAATLAITPGATAPTLVAGVTGSTAGEGCRVCHTLSGDGTTLLTQTGNSYGQTRYYDIATGAPNDAIYTSDTSGIFAWAALTQNAGYGVSNAGAGIAVGPGTGASTLYNMATGSPIGGTGLGGVQMTTPSFAPNDSQITFNYWNADTRSLGIMNFNEGTLNFSGLHAVYTPPSGQVVWPTFTPASDQIIFGTQYSGPYGFTWTGSTADLWRYDSGSGAVAPMSKANGIGLPSGGGHTGAGDAHLNFEPTMNPTPVAQTGGFAWVVFTSRRLFGNVATLDPYCSDARTCDDRTSPTPKKLWMAAVNPGVTGGADPSAPAFYLPGQELLAGNSRGFWVLNQCAPAGTTAANSCDTDLDCCQSPAEERCVAANSIPPIKKYCTAVPMLGTCAPDNTACTNISQCCGALTGSQCILGTCTPPPPLVTFSGSSFTRDYVGSCDEGFGVVWRFFSWQSYTPGNSFIQFTGQTAADASDIVGMSPPPVNIGKAESNIAWPLPAQTPSWTSASQTVDDLLRAVGQTSNSVLRVTAYLNPATAPSQTPVLEDWRATYDCEPIQ